MDDVVVEYQIAFNECRRMLLGTSPKANRAFTLIMVCLAVLAAVSVVANNDFILSLIEALFLSFCLATRLWLGPRRYWKNASGIQEPRTVTFNDEGFVRKSASEETTFTWSQYSGTRETKETFILLPSPGGYSFFVPKRALRSEEDEAKLRALLASHAPTTTEDRLVRKIVVTRLWQFSIGVFLTMFIYVAVRYT